MKPCYHSAYTSAVLLRPRCYHETLQYIWEMEVATRPDIILEGCNLVCLVTAARLVQPGQNRWRLHRGMCEAEANMEGRKDTSGEGGSSGRARNATSMERVSPTVKLPEYTRRGQGRDVCATTTVSRIAGLVLQTCFKLGGQIRTATQERSGVMRHLRSCSPWAHKTFVSGSESSRPTHIFFLLSLPHMPRRVTLRIPPIRRTHLTVLTLHPPCVDSAPPHHR